MRILECAASLLALAAAVDAQAPTTARPGLAFIGGVGSAMSVSQPGIDRRAGAAVLGDIELNGLRPSGLASRVGLRVEAGLATQKLSAGGGPVAGNVQTVHASALGSLSVFSRLGADFYGLAGPVWARPSTKIVLDAATTQTPGSNFEQTTHETVAGVLLGAGAGRSFRSVGVRIEARWMSLATDEKTTQLVPLFVSVVVPLRR